MKVEEDVREDLERTVSRIRTIVRNAKDRFPQLRVLRILIFLRLLDSAVLERRRAFLDARRQALIAFRSRIRSVCQLLCVFRVRTISHCLPHTLMKAPSFSSSNSFVPPFGHSKSVPTSTTICPSASTATFARSIGRGAGPSKLIPSLS